MRPFEFRSIALHFQKIQLHSTNFSTTCLGELCSKIQNSEIRATHVSDRLCPVARRRVKGVARWTVGRQ